MKVQEKVWEWSSERGVRTGEDGTREGVTTDVGGRGQGLREVGCRESPLSVVFNGSHLLWVLIRGQFDKSVSVAHMQVANCGTITFHKWLSIANCRWIWIWLLNAHAWVVSVFAWIKYNLTQDEMIPCCKSVLACCIFVQVQDNHSATVSVCLGNVLGQSFGQTHSKKKWWSTLIH